MCSLCYKLRCKVYINGTESILSDLLNQVRIVALTKKSLKTSTFILSKSRLLCLCSDLSVTLRVFSVTLAALPMLSSILSLPTSSPITENYSRGPYEHSE